MHSPSRPVRPVRFVSLVVFALACAPAVAQAQAKPSGKEVMDRYIEATGGRAAYEKIKNRVSKTTVEIPAQGLKGDVTIYQQSPDKGYVETNITNIGKIEQGYDGRVAWEKSAMMGPRVLEGQEKESIVRSLTLGSELNPEKYYPKIETVGEEAVDGKPAWKVELTTPGGAKETRWYDKDGGLMLKTETMQKTQMGEVKVTGTPSEYKPMGGITVPTKITQNMMGQTITLTMNSVEHNVDIPADKFQLPADVKALVDKAGATTGAAPATQPK